MSKTKSTTKGVDSEASLSADFYKIFSASVDIKVSYSETISEMSGYTVPLNCTSGDTAVLYWTPPYTHYQGSYEPSDTQADWYIAQSGSTAVYDLQCTGST